MKFLPLLGKKILSWNGPQLEFKVLKIFALKFNESMN